MGLPTTRAHAMLDPTSAPSHLRAKDGPVKFRTRQICAETFSTPKGTVVGAGRERPPLPAVRVYQGRLSLPSYARIASTTPASAPRSSSTRPVLARRSDVATTGAAARVAGAALPLSDRWVAPSPTGGVSDAFDGRRLPVDAFIGHGGAAAFQVRAVVLRPGARGGRGDVALLLVVPVERVLAFAYVRLGRWRLRGPAPGVGRR